MNQKVGDPILSQMFKAFEQVEKSWRPTVQILLACGSGSRLGDRGQVHESQESEAVGTAASGI